MIAIFRKSFRLSAIFSPEFLTDLGRNRAAGVCFAPYGRLFFPIRAFVLPHMGVCFSPYGFFVGPVLEKFLRFSCPFKLKGFRTCLNHTGKSDFIKAHLKNFSKIYWRKVRKFPI